VRSERDRLPPSADRQNVVPTGPMQDEHGLFGIQGQEAVPVHDRARDAHIPLGKIDVAPFQAEHLALSQAGRGCKENQRSFSNV